MIVLSQTRFTRNGKDPIGSGSRSVSCLYRGFGCPPTSKIHALAPLCPNLKLVDTHATPDPESVVFHPDFLEFGISVYKSRETIVPITQFSRMETHIEVELDGNDDAFLDDGVFEHEP